MRIRWSIILMSVVLLGAAFAAASAQVLLAPTTSNWPQWGQNSEHQGFVPTIGQPAARFLATVVYDPFTAQSEADPLNSPNLLVHYQAPILDGANDVFMLLKTGQYTTMDHWETQIWNEQRLHWESGALVQKWVFQSDWKPVPFLSFNSFRGPSWEPVFHPALSAGYLYIPGFGGTVYQVNKGDGSLAAHINPFGTSEDPSIFLTGPITADSSGNIYYNAVKLVITSQGSAWDNDVVNSWLVKISSNGSVSKATYASLVPGAPGPTGFQCVGVFQVPPPWPPSPNAVPPNINCGSVRTALNIAPAVGPDGTIYVPAVHHFSTRTAYMLAVNSNLTPKWQTSLRDRFNDGCNVYLPPNGSPGGCKAGAHTGVDPAQNRPGAGRVIEDGTYSPTVAPDGSIFFGTYSRYNWAQGHMMKFSSSGQFLASYIFGWDITPAIYQHNGTYSVVMKDNHYSGLGSYCNDDVVCPPDRTASDPANPESFFITQLSKDLVPEWSYQNTNNFSCTRNPDGTITCVNDHPHGFEWCINAPAVDGAGVVYANSEDGNLYTINQGGGLRDKLFLNLAIGAAYTPLGVAADGKLYTENNGTMFVVGR